MGGSDDSRNTKVEGAPTKVEGTPTKVEGVPTKVEGVPTKVERGTTVFEGDVAGSSGRAFAPGPSSVVHGYEVVCNLPAAGGEGDIFVVVGPEGKRVLKLYRYGMEPRKDAWERIAALSLEHRDLVRILETGYDAPSGRWYEIQEHVAGGTLRDVLKEMRTKCVPSGSPERANLLRALLEQVSNSLSVLHGAGILHLDVKPENILVRSREPLEFALADFGTVSVIDPEVLAHLTRARGTPMYQSPESLIGNMGRSSDWWCLGMTALETFLGANPFEGIPENGIRSSITNNPAPIPEGLPEEYERLFKGLLTRSMENRWSFDQTKRWLSGEQDIPVRFEQAGPMEGTRRGFEFMGRFHRDNGDLAAAFASDEESWSRGREHLMRGNVRRWLDGEEKYDLALDLDMLIKDAAPDDAMFRFATRYAGLPAPVLNGKALTPGNLRLFVGKLAKGETISQAERSISKRLLDGSLKPLLDYYAEVRGTGAEISGLLSAADYLKGKSVSEAFEALDAIVRPKEWHLPFLPPDAAPETVTRALREMEESGRKPWSAKRWEEFVSRYVCPGEVVSLCGKSPKGCAEGESILESLERRGLLIPVSGLPKETVARFEKGSLREYEVEACRIVWGYDEEMERTLSSISDLLSAKDVHDPYPAARRRLFEAYASPFVGRERRIPPEDRALLLAVRKELSLKDFDWRSLFLPAIREELSRGSFDWRAFFMIGSSPAVPEDVAEGVIERLSKDSSRREGAMQVVREYERLRDESVQKLRESEVRNRGRRVVSPAVLVVVLLVLGLFMLLFSNTGKESAQSFYGQLRLTAGLAIDLSGNIYLVDRNNDRVHKFDSTGRFLTKWGRSGAGNGRFSRPNDVTVDASGNIYVTDQYNHRVQKFDSNGRFLAKWGRRGSGDGEFDKPNGIAVDSSGVIFVVDEGNNRIQKFDSTGRFLTKWGRFGRGDGQFSGLCDVTVDASGNIYVTDQNNHRVQKFDSNGRFLAKWGRRGSGDEEFQKPRGIAVDSSGSIYVTDPYNHRVQKFDSNGRFLAKWGRRGSGDEEFDEPNGIAVDSSGVIFVVDAGHNNRIQKFDSNGRFLAK